MEKYFAKGNPYSDILWNEVVIQRYTIKKKIREIRREKTPQTNKKVDSGTEGMV